MTDIWGQNTDSSNISDICNNRGQNTYSSNISDICVLTLLLHERHIMHGDLYAHNILVNQAADCLLGDFGAATLYTNQTAEVAAALERIEVRAFGYLLEELLVRLDATDRAGYPAVVARLASLQERCLNTQVMERPSFSEVVIFIWGQMKNSQTNNESRQ